MASSIRSAGRSALPRLWTRFRNQSNIDDQSPEEMLEVLLPYLKDGIVNIIGGCCGTTPAHIEKIAQAVKNHTPRKKETVSHV